MKLRLLETGFSHAAQNMAIDEAVLNAVAAGDSPATLRLYGWKPAALSIGYFQSLSEEVDLEACKKMGVEYVRRMTGGGAVFHDEEITYSIHIPERACSELGVPLGILESYAAICEGVLKGVAEIGKPGEPAVAGKFVPLNDLVAEFDGAWRKFSGNAQTRKQGVIVQHGTILLKVDVEKMFSLLKVPSEKLKGKLIADIKERVTSLSQVVGREVGFDEAAVALKKGFKKALHSCEFVAGELSEAEKAAAAEFAKTKYGSDVWNRKR